ncbi:MAG: acyl carrier protein [Deltaproteobacteria bacterium]|nr:acyl carrier protein [Deltaproteobacteria bacterium]
MTIKEEVLAFFAANAKKPIPGETEAERLECRYLDLGIIDSVGIVKLIMEFEEKHGIYFDMDYLQSYEFQTISGLIGIIEQLMGGKK